MSTHELGRYSPQQNSRGRRIGFRRPSLLVVAAVGIWIAGCAKPNPVTIQLRKDTQTLQERIDKLKNENEANLARIAALEQQKGTAPTLPQSRLEQMFTVHGIQLGRLTGGTNLDPNRPDDQGLRVYLAPVDETGDITKATGRATVEAFDLAKETDNRIGCWEFNPQTLKNTWRALGPLHNFVLVCPWQTVPQHPEITIKVTFLDELTGRTYTALKDVKVKLPPTTQPTTQP